MASRSDIYKFKADMATLAARLNVKVSTVVRATTMRIVADILKAHPVDTGYSRANWRVAADAPDQTVSAALTPAQRSSMHGTGSYPQREPTAADLPSDATHVFITNSVYYVQFLEQGSSKKAPAFFIRTAAQNAAASIKDAVHEAKGTA